MTQFQFRLQNLRKCARLKQRELAEMAGLSSGDRISLLERKKANPQIDELIKLAQFFDCSVDYLVGATDNPNPTPKDPENTK